MNRLSIAKRFSLVVICLTFALGLATAPLSGIYADSSNLMPNPLVETSNSDSSSLPLDWTYGSWGTNNASFTYQDTGSAGDSNSLDVNIGSYTSGAAEWFSTPIAVTAGDAYTYGDYYNSAVPTEVDLAFTMSDGSTQYMYLGSVTPSSGWQEYSASFTAPASAESVQIYHLLYSAGDLQTDNFSLTQNTASTISISTPSNNATVSGITTLSSSPTSQANLTNITYYIDGASVGSATASPYQLQFDTTGLLNGIHTLTATANYSDGSSTSSSIFINSLNNSTSNGNVLPDPTLTTVNPANPDEPANWQPINWGTNTASFSYHDSGYDGSDSLTATLSNYTSGSAEWFPEAIPVVSDQQYAYSDYYESNTPTTVEAVFNLSDGSTDYETLGFAAASSSWAQFKTTFNFPLGTTSFSVYQYLNSAGTLTTSDYSVTPYYPVGFSSPLLTLTFDDGYRDTYSNAIQPLKQDGFSSTQFIITSTVNSGSLYVTSQDLKNMAQDGEEIASHTVTHTDLALETPTEVNNELSQSKSQLEKWTGQTITDFAYPFGIYNSQVQSEVRNYYSSARGIEPGLNSAGNFNAYDLKVENIYTTTTTDQVQDWVKQAINTNTWLILVYHDVTNTPIDDYSVTPDQLSQQLAVIKSSGIPVVNMHGALSDIEPQLSK